MQHNFTQTQTTVTELTRIVERLMYEMNRTQERHESEQRQLLLESENRMLRSERGLPPAPNNETDISAQGQQTDNNQKRRRKPNL